MTDLILIMCYPQGITPREVTEDEVFERCYYRVVNEAFRELESDHSLSPDDIDVTFVHRFGYPRNTGGPIWHAEKESKLVKKKEDFLITFILIQKIYQHEIVFLDG